MKIRIVKVPDNIKNSTVWKHDLGGFLEGRVYDLDEITIRNLIEDGYEIKYL